MIVGQVVLISFVYINVALWAGQYIDSKCVEGRLSQAQAEAVSVLEWKKCPRYRIRQNGKCEAKKNYRVVVDDCSKKMRSWTGRDSDSWKWVRRAVLCDSGLPLGDHVVCHPKETLSSLPGGTEENLVSMLR